MTLNQDQNTSFQEAFRMFDKDNDGHITRSECHALLKKLGESSYDAETAISQMLGSLDRNESGTIDYHEFIHLMQQQSSKASEGTDEAKKEFTKYDTNRDGHICKNELNDLLKANGAQKSDTEVDSMLREVDADSDGRINHKEFAKVME